MHLSFYYKKLTHRMSGALVLFAAMMLTGCANFYVDGTTKEVPVSEMKAVANAKPVAVVFEFQTNGVSNAMGTKALKEMVVKQISESGLFSSVEGTPSANTPILNVTLNNVALVDEAMRKGFLTGLSFGAAGNTVTDGYICTLTYLPAGQVKPVVTTARHAIHTALGSAGAPPGGIKVGSIDEAVTVMTRAILSNALRDLSRDAGFNN